MEMDFWYLAAIPLLFAAGWWLRGLDEKQRRAARRGVDDTYFQGLSLLLSNQSDKAVDLFLKVVQLDPETIELHHALGNLFRRRGEFERAIRLHAYLANRAELPENERLQALSELALDFWKAGMYDRAESTYELLAKHPERRLEAARALVRIYCTEKEWRKAVEESRVLEAAGEDCRGPVAHYLCELAQEARRAKDIEGARRHALAALEKNPDSPRALALLADIALDAGDVAQARRRWNELEERHSGYLPLVAARRADVIAEKDPAAAADYLKDMFEKTGSVDVLREAVRRIAAWQGASAAGRMAAEGLELTPTLPAFAVAARLRAQEHPEDAQAQTLAKILEKQAHSLSRYQCRCCGYQSQSFAWQCPGCEVWDAFPPLRVGENTTKGPKPPAPAA